jgi:curved DNA-binding protein CbpA
MKTGDPYKILGIKPQASPQEIRRAYLSLVKKYHPDKNNEANAQEIFLAIQGAYEQLVDGKVSTESTAEIRRKENSQAQEDARQRASYEAYRKYAREKFAQRKAAEEAYKIAYLKDLKSSWKGLWHKTAAALGLCLFVVTWLDFFLTEKTTTIYPASFGTETYQSMNDHFVQLFNSTDGRNFWISDYFSQDLIKSCSIQSIESPWLRQVKYLRFQDRNLLKEIPVHFTFYWAQIWVSLLFLFPFISWRYASADIIFVAGSFFSRFVIGPFIIYFLLTENRWLHLLSFGIL